MPRAYSLGFLRERVVGSVASGEPCRAVAELVRRQCLRAS